MKNNYPVLLLILLTFVISCKTTKNASILNEKVSEGIEKYQLEVEKVINTLAEVELQILNESWNEIYSKVEKRFVADNGLNDANSLNHDHRRMIAANAAKVYYDLKDDIAEIQDQLLEQSRKNATLLIEMNNEVTKYLLSLEDLEAAQQNVLTKIQEISGVNFDSLKGKAQTLIQNF